LKARSHTWLWRCVGTAFEHFLLGSHNLMVTALGSCVKSYVNLQASVVRRLYEYVFPLQYVEAYFFGQCQCWIINFMCKCVETLPKRLLHVAYFFQISFRC
jgi:hypothetical protein